jgi:metal-responsive CopG/Arc/MetJ family transcriptional regulator
MAGKPEEILSVSVLPEMKQEFEQLAAERGMGAGELFRDMLRLYRRYQEQSEFRRLQRYGTSKLGERNFESEEDLLDALYADR